MSGLSPVPRIPKRPSTRNGSEAASSAATATGSPIAHGVAEPAGPAAQEGQRGHDAATPTADQGAAPSPGSRTVPQATAVSTPRPTAGASQDHSRLPQAANSACPTTSEAARINEEGPIRRQHRRRA